MMFKRTAVVAVALLSGALALNTIAPAHAQDTINPTDFSPTITNQYFPLSTLDKLVYEGEVTDPDTGETVNTRTETTIRPQTRTVAGVTVLISEDKNFEDGQLVELTLDYFAQHRDGSVYYFGEDVDNYENGVVVNHDGAWLAGEGQNLPGLFLPATPVVGQEFQQERAPGIAEDSSKILSLNVLQTTPAGSFTGCIKTEDTSAIDNLTENKWYCPGVGLVREQAEDETLELLSYTKAPPATPTAAATMPAAATPVPTRPSGVTIAAPSTGSGPQDSGTRAALFLAASAILLVLGVGSISARAIIVRRNR